MFDSGVELPALGAAQLAGLIEQTHTELKAQECRMPQLACAWADAHYLDSGSTEYQPVIQRACAWGGEGTPEVSADSTEPAEPNRSYVNAAEPDVPHHDEAEPDLTCEDEPEIDPAADEHQSPSMTVPPGFDAQAARPRAVLHFHLAETTLRTGQA